MKEGFTMLFNETEIDLNGKKVLLRNARLDEAEMLIDYLKRVSGETRFLLCEPDEIKFTIEEEKDFIKKHNDSPDNLLVLAFVDGEYAGNCSFEGLRSRKRSKHRADIGIALFQEYTGFGLGRLMLNFLLDKIKEQGYEQAELTVVGGNDRAYHLYESVGFIECGRIPNANKYTDGTYSDDIMMVLRF